MDVIEVLEKADKKLMRIHPFLSNKARQLIRISHAQGIFIIITQGKRSNEEQNRLYAQGRSNPGKIVTNVRGGYSYHNYGLAFDYCVCDIIGGKLIPNWSVDKRWLRVGNLGKNLGLEWGGDWKSFKDYPHFQYTFGLSIEQLRNGGKLQMTTEVKDKKRYRLMTGTFNSKQEAEKVANDLRKQFGWIVYVKDA